MKLILFFALIFNLNAKASVQELNKVFHQTFTSNYVRSRCVENIIRLINSAKLQGIDISEAKFIEIENVGHSVFGLLNAEMARESGLRNREYPASGLPFLPGETNWYHHAILELDGYIFDYDFTNSPKVLIKAAYFENMFLQEKSKDLGGKFNVGREQKLTTYKLTIRAAESVLNASQNRVRISKATKGTSMTLEQFINQ